MEMNDFLEKYGGNTQSDEAWIFTDSPPTTFLNTFEFVGMKEKKTQSGKDMPYLEVVEIGSKVKMNISWWSTTKSLDGLVIGDRIKVTINDNGKLALTKVSA